MENKVIEKALARGGSGMQLKVSDKFNIQNGNDCLQFLKKIDNEYDSILLLFGGINSEVVS